MIYNAHLDVPLSIMTAIIICILLIGASIGAIVTCRLWEHAENKNIKWWDSLPKGHDKAKGRHAVASPPPSVKRRAYPGCPPY